MRAIALGIAGTAIVAAVATARDKPPSRESIECSRQAGLQHLQGAARRDFQTKCMGTAARPGPLASPSAVAEGNEPLSREEMIAVINALRPKWNAHGYVGDPIDVNIHLRPDGTLSKPPQIVSKPSDDPNYKAAIKDLTRAITQTQPFLMLRMESYAHWKSMMVTFDPRVLR